jgi:thimet oligopeptidase
MSGLLAVASLWALALASGATAAPAIPPTLTGSPTAAQINERCAWFITNLSQMREALEKSTGKPGVETTLRDFDAFQEMLNASFGESTLWREVAMSAESREAGQKCEVASAAEANKINLSRPIYDRLKAIPTPADPATALYLKRQIEAFDRAGVGKDEAGRAEVQKVSDDVSALISTFEANIPKGQRSIMVRPAELDGLPQDYIDAHKPGADGLIKITTDYPDYGPVMTYAKNDDVRRRLSIAYNRRAYPENDAVLRDLINRRDDLARLLGRPDYASLFLEDRMIKSPEKVLELVGQMAAAAKPAAESDYAKKLASLRELDPAAKAVELWQTSFANQRVQKALYGYDRQEARKYFAYDNVRDGILKLTEDMFGVQIRKWDTPVWDRLVEPYEMIENGKVIGRFIFDNHPRRGKYEHANAGNVRLGVGDRIPVAMLVMNVPAGDHSTGLMEHGDVVTFLHEYGHLLHAIFGGQKQRWAGLSGIATEFDFAEAPSQMLEDWVYDYETLKRFAVDAKGNPIPKALVDQMNNARYFDMGMADMRLIGYSNVSLRYYMGRAPADLGAAFRTYSGEYDLLRYPAEAQTQDSFSHLGSYGPSVYTYNWSRVISDDLLTEFRKTSLRDRATAERYRRRVLEPGGSKPAADLVADFLGRPISIEAYRARMAKAK